VDGIGAQFTLILDEAVQMMSPEQSPPRKRSP
jgi:hypothetical protein